MEYNNTYNVFEIKKYSKYFHCLNKKIIILKDKKDNEYIDNMVKCENYLNIVYPKIKLLIKNINKNQNIDNINELYNLGILYNFK